MSGYDRICSEFTADLNTAYQILERIWVDIGICDEQRKDRSETVVIHLRNLLDEIVVEEEDLRQSLTNKVEECKKLLATLCRELDLPAVSVRDGLTVLQKEKELRRHISEMKAEKATRMQDLEVLQKEDQVLCDALAITPYYVPTNTVPSETQLAELRQHVMQSKLDKENRFDRFVVVKKSIVELMNEMEKEPETMFENEVVNESEVAFILSASNMKSLEELHHQLEIIKRDAEQTYRDLMDRIVTLWDRLEVTVEDRQVFCAANVGYTHKTTTNLRTELMRCEQLKLLNIENFVKGMRKELVDWWNKCFYSVDQRSKFTFFTEEVYTEELLQLHESEVQVLHSVYCEAEDLYKKVHRRQTVFQSIKEFEKTKMSDDPNRFNNRGGRLNILLKANNKDKKELPIIEKELKYVVAAWERTHDSPFLLDGLRYEDFIRKEWSDWDEEQSEVKRMRQLQKAKTTVQEMTFGSKPSTPIKRRLCTTGTPTKQPTPKMRKIFSDVSKLMLQHMTPDRTPRSSQLTSTFSTHFGLPPSGKTPSTLTKETPKVRRSRRLAGARRILGDHNATTNTTHMNHSSILSDARSWPNTSLASAGSYHDFAVGLEKRTRQNTKTANAFRI